MNIRSKAVLFNALVVLFTASVTIAGAMVIHIQQIKHENRQNMSTVFSLFQKSFEKIPENINNQFDKFSKEKNIAFQTLRTIQSGWSLDVGLSFTGYFSKYQELLIDPGELDQFAFYYAPQLTGEKALSLYYDRDINNLIEVENNRHYKLKPLGRELIADPAIFTAISLTIVSSSSTGTTLFTKPILSASFASIKSPVKINSFALCTPTIRCNL